MSRSRHVGKIRKRLEEIKNQSVRPTKADFSHHESVRLATDALLDGGTETYLQALNEEGEVDFLSSVEAQYIKKNAREPYYANESHAERETGPRQNDAGSLQSGTYFPISEGSEPALLHTWSTAEKPYLKEKSSATVYFQTEKNSNIRDIIRRCISKTSQVLAIMMDVFTDTEIFCDVLEAANKRGVFVYLLLDQSNIKLFSEMCDKVQIAEDHFKVHRNFLSKFTGQVVELFDEEFRHLYALSKPVMGLRSPTHTVPFLLNTSTTTQGSLTSSSNQGSANTPSDPFSSLSANSTYQTKQPPSTHVYSSTPTSQSTLHRGNSFHGYTSFMSTQPWKTIQTNYYQWQHVADTPALLYNNVNIYKPMRFRQDDVNRSRLNPLWRCLHKANLIT
ncbi:barrier-to-autointegration factor [Platysternon megacephalum]|uniref:Barrier-to-autointegration factor n=1 Tax=Platysternon megacephalum TaxID=55544 RepID=A0A4D9F3I5_9SAUR|nr:barrier-to-autointegration factor [Platysternon megacephalum]